MGQVIRRGLLRRGATPDDRRGVAATITDVLRWALRGEESATAEYREVA